MACDPLIDDGFVFPRRANNRPALPHIGYRIGRYDDFVEAMLRAASTRRSRFRRGPIASPTIRRSRCCRARRSSATS